MCDIYSRVRRDNRRCGPDLGESANICTIIWPIATSHWTKSIVTFLCHNMMIIIWSAIPVMFGKRIIKISCACIFLWFFFFNFSHLCPGQENKYLGSPVLVVIGKQCSIRMFLYSLYSFTKIQKSAYEKWYIVSTKTYWAN